MRTPLLLLCLLAACFPPMHARKLGVLIEDLDNVHQWDPARGAFQSPTYHQLLSIGDDALEALAHAVTDERATQIMEMYPTRIPLAGDVAFLIALKIQGARIEDYRSLGVRRGAHPNPIFALEWEIGARVRVRDRMLGR